ncbi:MAG: methyltransferase [Bacillales bacterium]|jgi:ubiquinone/menaquinone biosynthesis C-methylase UbiE|nr:methyltransferase [Bacillales bacterium]
MSYELLAYYYDDLMKDVEYENWLSFFENNCKSFDLDKNIEILDLGCGTGIFISLLLEMNYKNVYGLDLSDEMLSVAYERLEEQGQYATLFQGDMTEFELDKQFDVIIIFCDGLNYIKSKDDVIKTFRQVKKHLRPGGLFMFDVHSIYKIITAFNNQTYSIVEEDFALIWATLRGENENSVEHELTFFIQNEEGSYDKYTEFQQQCTYPVEDYKKWLEDENFSKIEFLGDFSTENEVSTSERILFCTQYNG